jgi:sulfur carrier protein ThiS
MQVRLKLMGMLKAKTPPGGVLDVAEGATIADVLLALDIAAHARQAITVNGRFERNRRRALVPDDELTVIPPVGGG